LVMHCQEVVTVCGPHAGAGGNLGNRAEGSGPGALPAGSRATWLPVAFALPLPRAAPLVSTEGDGKGRESGAAVTDNCGGRRRLA
jgi:hypothetical protein